jgi:hypothetical protein
MTTLWITLAIVSLAYAIPSAIRTARRQLADPAAVLLVAIGAAIVAAGMMR